MTIHLLPSEVQEMASPKQFTYPFCYEPHPLCVAAAAQLRAYLEKRTEWKAELQAGKMMGVLVVQHGVERGFLAAFSGTLDGRTQHEYFVPPVFDLMAPGCYFQQEEKEISRLNERITQLQAQLQPSPLRAQMQQELDAWRMQMRQDKEARHRMRGQLSPEEWKRIEPEMIRQSQFQKAELRRKQQFWNSRVEEAEAPLRALQAEIDSLQAERQARSQVLQQWLFRQFVFLNANGLKKSLLEVFQSFAPPSGSGECCAPKLLQAAYLHHLQPLCMAEFWVGDSPRDELRQDGHYYPSCNSKCRPILRHMLQGLDVEPNPLYHRYEDLLNRFRIVYQDADLLVVYKPAGMLSVAGKDDVPSVQDVLAERFSDVAAPLMVHRLDMDTSGLMLVALTEKAHSHLQRQFLRREVQKMYIAHLERPMTVGQEGDISLPLSPDYADRPRQRVDYERGKEACTHFCVLSVSAQGHSRVALWPHTGRTHQLRVHCAHPDGLANSIVGDRLYGHPSARLMLHAQSLCFTHPVSGENMKFEQEEI